MVSFAFLLQSWLRIQIYLSIGRMRWISSVSLVEVNGHLVYSLIENSRAEAVILAMQSSVAPTFILVTIVLFLLVNRILVILRNSWRRELVSIHLLAIRWWRVTCIWRMVRMVDIVSSRVLGMETGVAILLLHHMVVHFARLGIRTSLVA